MTQEKIIIFNNRAKSFIIERTPNNRNFLVATVMRNKRSFKLKDEDENPCTSVSSGVHKRVGNEQENKKSSKGMEEEIGSNLKHPDAYKRFQGKEYKANKIKYLRYSKKDSY